MASETLAVPEEHLAETVKIIRAGLRAVRVDPEVREALTRWCTEMDDYVKRLQEAD